MKQYKYRVNGQTYDVVINEINGKNAKVEVNGISFDVEMEGEGGEGIPSISGISVITSIEVAVGDAVKKGQTVVVLEAMKMQNNINAENDGTVTSITVNKGDSVMEGTVLLTIG